MEQSPSIPNEGFSFGAHVAGNQRIAVVSAMLDTSSTPEGLDLLSIISGSTEGLVQSDYSVYNDVEQLFAEAGFTASEVWQQFYH